ncbi:Arc family DNA-binding protein [Acetobacter musti]|uniref:Arc family DNA-binding protein n=1 Tax=Acetobacter musti TaxID=864732 RepID=A0ABX0JTF3_9PROT|nr:Arc family DNA-binding protein [Acetobacter musti]NHN85810.1 Arc family DNA-binding protein [Acetobacter musti]
MHSTLGVRNRYFSDFGYYAAMQDLRRSSITVRLGEELLHALRIEAAKRPQSVNAEIVQRLEESLKKGSLLTDALEEFDRDNAPKDSEERALMKIFRGMTAQEKAVLKALLNGFINARDMV